MFSFYTGMDGFEFTRQARTVLDLQKSSFVTTIIGVTADASSGTHLKCIEAGMAGVFVKPCTVLEMKRLIMELPQQV